LQILRPLLAQTGAKPQGRVVLGTVQGDLHDIGKNLVAALLEGGGFEVTDLGVDVSPEKFIAAVQDKQAQIVGLSALLTTTMPAMKTAIEAFGRAGIRERIKVMVGGAPVTKGYADSIGADGYGENAAASVDLARRLVGAEKIKTSNG
jgi:5-methyltetrahydrofolate--homocysteine methyltransferase